jgi:hypothetical protein
VCLFTRYTKIESFSQPASGLWVDTRHGMTVDRLGASSFSSGFFNSVHDL